MNNNPPKNAQATPSDPLHNPSSVVQTAAPLHIAEDVARETLAKYESANIHDPIAMVSAASALNSVLRGLLAALDAERSQATEVEIQSRELSAALAELETLRADAEKVALFCAQRAEYVTNLRNCAPSNDHDYYRWTGHAEARRQLSQKLGLPVVWPLGDGENLPPRTQDPNHALLHHDYATPHDLPAPANTPESLR